ncbi:Rpn family recombination-promoting nuclease/putative transposase [Paraliomyxa miuraensis]|uniref:Rpn family recombination-promoting nuclease/putative transposase n=1 Tax=Paraliomyxa miuraensis TaxID=376150 RepID=UPI00224F298C|nr:Rpn family recombination-promoting nuclease/putative transposase [Paraliomyxa miuraensis]MCX4240772.1 Rpn family recombination-promoting nuclease/putative transposase [Paraliomyxa miuraensis]
MAEPEHPDIVTHPHDGLVKRFLERPEVAAVQLRTVLPPALVSRLDWSSLRHVPGSYIDPKLRPRHSDILYSIALARSDPGPELGSDPTTADAEADPTLPRTVLVYVLMEHQSSPQRMMAWRLLQYACRVWERYERQHPKTIESLPLLVPLLLYQGADGWAEPRRLSELLDVPPELLAEFPAPIELSFTIDELTAPVADSQARARAVALTQALRTLLYLAFHPEEITEERLAPLSPLLDTVGREWCTEDLQACLTYVLSAFGSDSRLRDILYAAASQETRKVFVSLADKLKTEGRTEGRTEGMEQMLVRLLERRGLPITTEVQSRITACTDQERLQRWFDRAIEARTLDEVFSDPD